MKKKAAKSKSKYASNTRTFNVYRGGKLMETIFAAPLGYDAEDMRHSLINDDGYPHDIRVTMRSRMTGGHGSR